MARPLRLEFPGAVYHLTGRSNGRQKIFLGEADRELFLDTLNRVVSRYDWICHGYCLMTNHYHLLVETPRGNLAIGMRQLNGTYTQSFNRHHKRTGRLFQGRYKAILLEQETYLLELCRYTVLNPVRVKAAGWAGAWKWSSYRATAGLVKVPGFLSVNWLLRQFSRHRPTAQQRYRAFVRGGLAQRPWQALKGQIYLASERFIEQHSTHKPLKEIQRGRLRSAKPQLARIFAKHQQTGIVRAYREHGYRLHEIAKHLGVHYATVSRRLKQLENSR